MRLSHVMIIALVVVSLSVGWAAPDDEESQPQESPYSLLWQQVGQLLGDREYGSAADLIEDSQTDPELFEFRDQLARDRKDIAELQRFADLVKAQAAKLKSGDSIKVGSSTYKVVTYVSDAQGDRLTLQGASSSTPNEKTLNELDYQTWIDLTQKQLTTSAADRYLLGMYLATVDRGNRKDARQALNLAAADKFSVNHWTDRLDAEVKAAAAAKTAKKAVPKDPILGSWRIAIKFAKKPDIVINETFRESGRTSGKSTWRKRGDGRYVMTNPNGGTLQLELDPSGEKLRGTSPKGHKVQGIRQAKSKK